MIGRRILHADLDAFFASVEQRDQPGLQGKPVIVGGHLYERGVVSAASYEARSYGVRSGMPLGMAHHLCPRGIFLPADFTKYREVSEQVLQILRSFSPLVEPVSLDEAFLDVTGCELLFGDAVEMARSIRRRVREQCGLAISVGVASNKAVAKIACSLGKPEGLVVVPSGWEKAFLEPLPIGKLWGVGPKTEERLRRLRATTIGQFAAWPAEEAARLLGETGRWLHQLANGVDLRPVVPWTPPKSVGHEITFPQDVLDFLAVKKQLLGIADVVGSRLRAEGFRGRIITLKVRYPDFLTITRRKTLPIRTASSQAIYEAALELFQLDMGCSWRLVGIYVSGFDSSQGEQLPFSALSYLRVEAVERVVDDIRHRLGEHAIMRAALLHRSAKEQTQPLSHGNRFSLPISTTRTIPHSTQ